MKKGKYCIFICCVSNLIANDSRWIEADDARGVNIKSLSYWALRIWASLYVDSCYGFYLVAALQVIGGYYTQSPLAAVDNFLKAVLHMISLLSSWSEKFVV